MAAFDPVHPVCSYCGQAVALTEGYALHPHRGDLCDRFFWCCTGCDAHVGCHVAGSIVQTAAGKIVSDGTLALGTLANAELRRARHALHQLFDPLWDFAVAPYRGRTRRQVYGWLASEMEIDEIDCHISHFDLATCQRAAECCRRRHQAEGLQRPEEFAS